MANNFCGVWSVCSYFIYLQSVFGIIAMTKRTSETLLS